MGILAFSFDPKAAVVAPTTERRGGDRPFFSVLDVLAELANTSLRNCSLFMLVSA
jgi:hypothetical protein